MNPQLSHLHVWRGRRTAVVGPDRSPDMVGQSAGGGAFIEEDDGIAEEDGNGDGEQEGEKPMAGGCGSIAGKGFTNGMVLR